jgi:O-antigen/teichoic acid export membrane protein
MIDYLRRLARTGTAYTASSVLAKMFAVFTLPLYTRYMTPVDFGRAEVLGVGVVVLSIIVRGGMVEALMRYHHHFADRQPEVARTAFWGTFVALVIGAAACVGLAEPIAQLLLRSSDQAAVDLVYVAVFGLVAFTFYELLLTFYRVDEDAARYATATVLNVLITIPLTVWLVVFEERGAEGYLLGNFTGTAIIVVGLLVAQRRRIGRPGMPLAAEMTKFGTPLVPAEVSLYALNFADRVLLINIPASKTQGLAWAGLYSVGVKLAQGVTVFVRAFQLAWPPLAYSISSDKEARVVYGRMLTYYLLVVSLPLVFLALSARLIADVFVAPEFFGSYRAIPLVATGIAFYGAYLVMVTAVARTGRTGSLFPVAMAGLAVNIALCLLLIPEFDIAGAGMSLIAAYLVILSLMFLKARNAIDIQLEWGRLAHLAVTALAVALIGEHLLPESGTVAYLLRVAWWGLYPLALLVTGFFSRDEIDRLRGAHRLLKRARDSKALPDGPALVEQMHDTE